MEWYWVALCCVASCALQVALCYFEKQLLKTLFLLCQIILVMMLTLLGATMEQLFLYLIISITAYLFAKVIFINKQGGKK